VHNFSNQPLIACKDFHEKNRLSIHTLTNLLVSLTFCLALCKFQTLMVQSSDPVNTTWSVGWKAMDVTESKRGREVYWKHNL